MMGEFFVEGLVYCIARAWIIIADFFKVTESERERQVRCLRKRGEEQVSGPRFFCSPLSSE